MGLLLYILALLIRPIILLAGLLYGLVKSFVNSKIGNGFKYADVKFFTMALAIDKYGNVVCAELFNDLLITRESSYPFGRIEWTISGVLGINQRDGTLTKAGRHVAGFLNWIEKEHCIKSIPKGL